VRALRRLQAGDGRQGGRARTPDGIGDVAAAKTGGRAAREGAFASTFPRALPDDPRDPGIVPDSVAQASRVHVAIAGVHRGYFELTGSVRPDTGKLMTSLAKDYQLSLVSGDHERDRERFSRLFGPSAQLRFDQSPLEKLEFIRRLQESGKTVVMVGDGLNDAGALKQSDVGVAVVENIGAFSPASDVILAADMVPRISLCRAFFEGGGACGASELRHFHPVQRGGIAIAAGGLLAPVVCAVLMPLSSVTVVAFACLTTRWLGRRILDGEDDSPAVVLDPRSKAVV